MDNYETDVCLVKGLNITQHNNDTCNKNYVDCSPTNVFLEQAKNKVFIQNVNPTMGTLEWEVQDEDYDYTQEVARSAYGDMLHDDERNALYYAGIADAVSRVRERGERVRVLDIGTGTGLLSMMAVRCGADTVTACEAFEPMAECAVKILTANNMDDKVRVIHKRSTELRVGADEDLVERANVLVAEVFDTELIGEGAISTYSHARDCLLTTDALLVPSFGRVFAQVVSSRELHAFSKPYSNIPKAFSHFILPPSIAQCPGTISLHDIQMSQLSQQSFTPVSQPIKVFEFDWSGRTIPLTKREVNNIPFIPLAANTSDSGTNTSWGQQSSSNSDSSITEQRLVCHAVLMWWDLTMDQVGKEILTCAPHWLQPNTTGPNSVPWRDHWMQAVYHLPPPLVTAAPATQGKSLNLTAARDEYSMWFAVADAPDPPPPTAPHCTCGVHISTTSRRRLAQLGDRRRGAVFGAAMERTLSEGAGSRGAWLLLGDCVNLLLIGRLAEDARASHVYIHEMSLTGRRTLAQFLDLNGLKRRVTVLPRDLDQLKPGAMRHEIGVVFSEPYFSASILPWHNLRVNVLLRQLAHILPAAAPANGAPAAAPANGALPAAPANDVPASALANGAPAATDCPQIIRLPTLNEDASPYSTGTNFSTISSVSPTEATTAVPGSAILHYSTGHNTPVIERPLMTSARVLPGQMTLYCLPVCFLNLWKIRAPCVRRCGFDLTIFDELIDKARSSTDDYMEAQPLWEYPCYALHTPIPLVSLDLSTDLSHLCLDHHSSVQLDLGRLKVCAGQLEPLPNTLFCSLDTGTEVAQELHYNGVAVWADWNFGDQLNKQQQQQTTISTGPLEAVIPGRQVVWEQSSHQGVHLPRHGEALLSHTSCAFSCSLQCDTLANISFSFSLQTH